MLGLYIHIPFCKKKCFYCDFFSVKYDHSLSQRYIDALCKHAAGYKNQKINTAYIGGGTPSALSGKQIGELMSAIKINFDLCDLKEFTFELNPESVSKEKLDILKNSGVNRLSMGLQSSDDSLLKKLGRIHDFDMFKKAYELAKNAGFDDLNIDLIYGLPGQTLKNWEQTLLSAVSFGSGHISLYPLSVEYETEFYRQSVKTDDDTQRNMYETAVRVLRENGFLHYEISNWAKPGKEAVHNSNYWRSFEYIALGAGASGYFNRFRYSNVDNIEKYIEFVSKNLPIENENDFINEELYEAESIMLGLRLLDEGVSEKCFKSKKNKETLEMMLSQGLFIKSKDRIKLSENIVFVSNSVLSAFMK
jgi:putative oxygen-independent coproporphyrinogen III oxidase